MKQKILDILVGFLTLVAINLILLVIIGPIYLTWTVFYPTISFQIFCTLLIVVLATLFAALTILSGIGTSVRAIIKNAEKDVKKD